MGLDVAAIGEWEGTWAQLEARIAPALSPIAQWHSDATRDGEADPGEPMAWIELGPADPLVVTLERGGRLVVEGRTSPWGPGYHQRVVTVLDALGRAFPGGWSEVKDDTGFFAGRKVEELERAFLAWALRLWSLRDGEGEAGLEGAAVCLGHGEGPAEVPPGHVATPFGFRSLEWVASTREALARALEGAPLDRDSRGAFLWWCRDPDAFDWVQLGNAICASEVIWRGLDRATDDPAHDARRRALDCYERALRLDPAAPVPLPELARLYALLGQASQARTWSERAGQAPFRGGYREGWISWPVGTTWSVEVPGWLRAGLDPDDGHDIFWDDGLTVHLSPLPTVSSFSAEEEALAHMGRLGPEERARAQVERFGSSAADGYALVLGYGPDVPELSTLIQGQVGGSEGRVSFTCVVRKSGSAATALKLARSLRPLPGRNVHFVS